MNAVEIAAAYEYCRQVTKRHAKSFYFSAKLLPKEKQKPIYALYALCRYVDDTIDNSAIGSEAQAAEAIENWQKDLDEIYRNLVRQTVGNIIRTDEKKENRRESAEQNPKSQILTAWRDMLSKYPIARELPLELMRGVLMDTHIKRYQTFDELYVYCYRVASVVGLMSSEIFGYEGGAETMKRAEYLGIAMQLTNILRDVGEDAQMNRIYLPQEDLSRFGVTETQIFDGAANENFRALIRFEIERARFYYVEAEKGIAFLHKEARLPVLSASRLYARILDEIEKLNYDVFVSRAHTTRAQKIFALPKLWREARKISPPKTAR